MREASVARLDSLAALVNEKVTTSKDPSLPYVGLEHLPSGGSSLLGSAESAQSISTNNVFRTGDVLFGKLRPRLRKSIRAPFDGYCSTDILVLRSMPDVDSAFAGFVLQSDAVFAEAIRTEEGTKMPRCSWSTLKKLRVYCPEPSKQQRIAEILSTVDAAMEQTEALIAKTRQIKAGLMHDLFTRGVTADGKLRLPREEAPQLYKESPLGWIPKEWRSALLGDETVRLTDGSHQSVRRETGLKAEVPFLFVSCVADSQVLWSQAAWISRETYSEISRGKEPHDGMVLFTVVGSIGRVGLMTSDKAAAFERNIACISPSPRVLPRFLAWYLQTAPVQGHCAQVAVGNAQKLISLSKLRQFPLVLPCCEEQKRIDERLACAQSVLHGHAAAMAKLAQLKAALSHDLLSGQVQVVGGHPQDERSV